ncbi:MAG: hypothetical protein IPN80_11535 [Flavobacterium sp.]|nr:hypothetical protein [Flavobacterium sp.]
MSAIAVVVLQIKNSNGKISFTKDNAANGYGITSIRFLTFDIPSSHHNIY